MDFVSFLILLRDKEVLDECGISLSDKKRHKVNCVKNKKKVNQVRDEIINMSQTWVKEKNPECPPEHWAAALSNELSKMALLSMNSHSSVD